LKKTRGILIVFLVFLIFSAYSLTASANGTETVQVETTSCLVSAQWLSVGDVEGHVIGLQKREGEAVLVSGETGKYLNVFTLDFQRGKGGTAVGYSKFTFEDGSSILCSWKASIVVHEELFSKEGEGTIVKGTGRFEGIKGTVSFTGKQIKLASEDPRMVGSTTYELTLP
jgi:hypothetical protein